MIPTLENIAEVANARLKAAREQAEHLRSMTVYSYDGSNEVIEAVIVDDERLLNAVINKACRFASKAGTAQAAVQWAITDLTPYDVLEPS